MILKNIYALLHIVLCHYIHLCEPHFLRSLFLRNDTVTLSHLWLAYVAMAGNCQSEASKDVFFCVNLSG